MRKIIHDVKEKFHHHHHDTSTTEKTEYKSEVHSDGTNIQETKQVVKEPGYSQVHKETVINKPAASLNTNLAPPPVARPLAPPTHYETGYNKEVFAQQSLSQNYLNEPALGMSAPTTTIQREYIEKPVIVRETILPEEKVMIQPIVHREREQTEVHEIVQPMKERDIMPTKVVYTTLPDQINPTRVENDLQFQRSYQESTHRYAPSTETLPTQSQTVEKAPILEEFIHKKIIEEVQPVLYKETIQPTVIEEVQPIYEKFVEAPVVSEEIRNVRELGTRFPSEFPNTTSNLGNSGSYVRHTFQKTEYGTNLGNELGNSPRSGIHQSTKRVI